MAERGGTHQFQDVAGVDEARTRSRIVDFLRHTGRFSRSADTSQGGTVSSARRHRKTDRPSIRGSGVPFLFAEASDSSDVRRRGGSGARLFKDRPATSLLRLIDEIDAVAAAGGQRAQPQEPSRPSTSCSSR